MNIKELVDLVSFWRWPALVRSLSKELTELEAKHAALRIEHERVVSGQTKLIEWIKVTHRLHRAPEGIRLLIQQGKRIVPLLALMFLLVGQSVEAGPAPPILRQPLTTNTHFGPVPLEGHVPIWNAAAKAWSNNIPSGGGNVVFADLVWTNDNGVLKPLPFPTNILLRVNAPDNGVATNFYFDSRIYRTNAASKLFAIYNGGSNALTVGPYGGIFQGRGNEEPVPGVVLYGIFDTALGETNQQEVFVMSQNSAVGYSGAADLIVDTNYGALLLLANKEGGVKFTRFAVQAGAGDNPQNFNTFTMQALVDGADYMHMDPNFTLLTPTNYLFSSSIRITNIHTLFSLQNSNFPVLEVDGVGDLRLIKKVPYLWPGSQGAASTALTNDGAGGLGWWPISVGAGGSLTTNANQFLGVPLSIKDGVFLTNVNIETSLQVSNGHAYLAGPVTNLTQLNLPHLTVSRSAVINAQGDVTNSSADANWSIYPTNVWNSRQGGSVLLSNLVANPYTGYTNQVFGGTNISVRTAGGTNFIDTTGFLNNWSLYSTNVWNSRQGGSATLTNLSGTGAITNLFTPSLSNATIKPLVVGAGNVAGATNTTGHIRGLEAGGNVTLSENGSNIVIAASVSGSGISTNANQFGPQVILTIKDGAFLTNLNVESSLEVSNGYFYASGPVTNGTQLNLPHLTVSRSAIINAQGDVTNSTADSNWSLYPTNVWNNRQGGSLVLTNLAANPYTGYTNQVFGGTNISVRTAGGTNFIDTIGFLNNWSLYPTNVWNSRQGGSETLTNLSGTGAITNVFSASLSNATMKPIVVPSANNFATNYTGQFYGLEQGANITLTPNGSNIVVASTTSGGSVTFADLLWTNEPSGRIHPVTFTNRVEVQRSITIGTNTATFFLAPNTNDFFFAGRDITKGEGWDPQFVIGVFSNTVSSLAYYTLSHRVSGQDYRVTDENGNSSGAGIYARASSGINQGPSIKLYTTNSYVPFAVDSITNITLNNVVYQFPDSQGANGTALTNNGSGALGWWPISVGGGNVNFSDLVWTNDAGTIRPNAFPTNILLNPNAPDNGTATNYFFDTQVYRLNPASRLFRIYNGGSNALTVGPFGGLQIGRANGTPISGNVLSATYNTSIGEAAAAQIELRSQLQNASYFGRTVLLSRTNRTQILSIANDNAGRSSTFDVTTDFTNSVMQYRTDLTDGGGSRGVVLSPGYSSLTAPTNYLFNTIFELTNIHTILSLQSSNTPMFEVDGIGDLKLLKRVPYSWPVAQGAAQTVLTNDGSGNLGWGTVSASGGPAALTNLFSQTLSNATIKPLVVGVGNSAGATNVTGEIRGLEAGTGITLTPNGSNYVIASTATGGGLATNATQFGASVELTIKSGALLTNTLHYPSNLTGPAQITLASVGSMTNLTEWRGTNGDVALAVSSNGLYNISTPLLLANAVAFRTNQIDFKLNQWQTFSASLKTNLVLQLTNCNAGVTHTLGAFGSGRLGGGTTNAWQLLCTADAGCTIYWPPGTTNGNYDVLINSNQVVTFTFRQVFNTNIFASYLVGESGGAN
jgi:hypothetical protein